MNKNSAVKRLATDWPPEVTVVHLHWNVWWDVRVPSDAGRLMNPRGMGPGRPTCRQVSKRRLAVNPQWPLSSDFGADLNPTGNAAKWYEYFQFNCRIGGSDSRTLTEKWEPPNKRPLLKIDPMIEICIIQRRGQVQPEQNNWNWIFRMKSQVGGHHAGPAHFEFFSKRRHAICKIEGATGDFCCRLTQLC